MDRKISIVYTEDHDWVGLYLDGKLVYEGHSLNGEQILQELGFIYNVDHVSNEWAEDQGGRFPDNEEDCAEGMQ